MILCLDCGNSRLKWGLRDGGEWRASGALALADIAQLVRQLPGDHVARQVIGCNVAGAPRAAEIEAALGFRVDWIAAQERQCGVVNGYEAPASLGADRWAALIGARALQRGAALVVLAGTATTIDVLDAEGRFSGGLILPGIDLMARALSAGTAQLPLPERPREFHPLPRNTGDAIASGAIQATLGAIQRMYAALPMQQKAVCLLSGGAAGSLLPHLELPFRHLEHLVLEGLARIAAGEPPPPA